MDLRQRVVAASDRGEATQEQLAARFQVTTRWVQKLLRQRRLTGSLDPKPHRGGRPAKVQADKERLLLRVLAQTPDASLDELRNRCDVQGSRRCIFRALRRLRVTRKKRRWAAPSNKSHQSRNSAGSGAGGSPALTRGV